MRFLDKFIKNQSGNVALVFALAAVSLAALAGGAVDYTKSVSAHASLQSVADAAALATARELQLSGAKRGGIDEVARQYIKANADKNLQHLNSRINVSEKKATVDIILTAEVPTSFMSLVGLGSKQSIKARAQARILGGLPLCVLALDTGVSGAISSADQAKLTATGCSLYSNSTSAKGITSWGTSELNTGLTCSAGGAAGGGGNYKPLPLTDCPAVADPLKDRPEPVVNSCRKTGKVYSSGYHLLLPGTYCKGLTITGTAKVLFLPGEYVIKDGRLEISGNAIAAGIDVGFFFQGPNAHVKFNDKAHIGLIGRNSGTMAGFLFYEDRNTTYNHIHEITSPNVLKLEGTIYLPQGEFKVAVASSGTGLGKIAGESAYTVIIAKKLTLSGISNLVLNTDYAASNVPLPDSISSMSGTIALNR